MTAPVKDAEGNYLPIARKGLARSAPWGYKEDPDDKSHWLPIPEQLDCLLEAKKFYSRGCSYRDIADWLSAKTGRPISHMGLFKRWKQEKHLNQSRAAKERWRKQFPEYAE